MRLWMGIIATILLAAVFAPLSAAPRAIAERAFPMDDNYLLACARYVELNPVRARLVGRAREWRWSSARAHLNGQDDGLVRMSPLLERVADWKGFLGEGLREGEREAIRASERTGRPLGDKTFVRRLEKRLDRLLTRQKPGPKAAACADQPKLL
jgi:putative transposase